MLHSIATVSLSGTLPEKLQACAAAGFDGVEIFENDLLYFDGSARDVRKMVTDLGLKILLFQPFREFEGAPRNRWQRNIDRAKRKFDLMAELGTDKILVCSNALPDALRDDAVIIDDLANLAEIAEKRGIIVGYEALAWGTHVSSAHHAWRLVNAVNHPNMGIILDSFHTLSLNDDPATLLGIPAHKIVFIQMADAPRLQMNVTEWSRHFRCFPGQGELDMAGFLAPIIASGYDGPLSLEIFNDGFRAAPPRPTAIDGRRSLLFLEEMTRKRLKDKPNPRISPTAQENIDELFTPPLSSDLFEKIEFLEFAVDANSARELGDWFVRLGFLFKGKHKTKNVYLYQNGSVSFVLNAEPQSFASDYFMKHGVSLCAIGVRVPNKAAALGRARLYGCPQFEGHIGEGEGAVPAIYAPDGSLIYFYEKPKRDVYTEGVSIYDGEFDFIENATQTTDYQAIDHVALGLPAALFNSWILFFRSALGLIADNQWTLQDPYGLMKSRVVRSANNALRLPLNSSDSRHTATARSVSAYDGSGVQHIALATADIFETVEKLKQSGAVFLKISANYYEDLATKFDLTDEFLEKIENAHILYDQDPTGGELLHVYTESFADRFYVEILERRGNYQQYGANNVAVRLTALARTRGVESPYDYKV
jgi:4-hydroxyphenylpyruvate dioxygenase